MRQATRKAAVVSTFGSQGSRVIIHALMIDAAMGRREIDLFDTELVGCLIFVSSWIDRGISVLSSIITATEAVSL
jgi:hypothetical protein